MYHAENTLVENNTIKNVASGISDKTYAEAIHIVKKFSL